MVVTCETVSLVPLRDYDFVSASLRLSNKLNKRSFTPVTPCGDRANPDTGCQKRHCFLLPPSADMLWYLFRP
ncbi:hypothetical protein FVEN_g12701 [Fusarium venenatum]|nr:hypothetical protein FVEN_g12701 [Fusarium venenatum]